MIPAERTPNFPHHTGPSSFQPWSIGKKKRFHKIPLLYKLLTTLRRSAGYNRFKVQIISCIRQIPSLESLNQPNCDRDSLLIQLLQFDADLFTDRVRRNTDHHARKIVIPSYYAHPNFQRFSLCRLRSQQKLMITVHPVQTFLNLMSRNARKKPADNTGIGKCGVDVFRQWMRNRVQSITAHQQAVKLTFNLGMGNTRLLDLLVNQAMAGAVQRKMTQKSI